MKDLLLCVHVVVKTLNLEIFTLSFGRLRQTIVLKRVLHVQNDYFSSFNQSDHCFLSSSLSLPSSSLKLPDLPIVYDGEGRGRNPIPTLPLNKKKIKRKEKWSPHFLLVFLITCPGCMVFVWPGAAGGCASSVTHPTKI